MAQSDPFQPYGPLREIAPRLHVMDGEWHGTAFKRRMSVLQLAGGELVVHNAFKLEEKDYAELEKLGSVAAIVVPNALHDSDAPAMAARFPRAKVLVSSAAEKKLRKRGRVDGVLPSDWPHAFASEIECLELEGTRMLAESAFFHKASRTLVLTDAVFNMRNEPKGLERVIFKLNRIYKSFGPSVIFRKVFTADESKLRGSIERILEWDFDRVIPNHGEILETGGKQAMRDAFSYLFSRA